LIGKSVGCRHTWGDHEIAPTSGDGPSVRASA
jgi:hypothetical protein